jgi:hypothetical protein
VTARTIVLVKKTHKQTVLNGKLHRIRRNMPKNTVYTWQKAAGSQVSSNIIESIDFFKSYFTNELVNEMVTEINNNIRPLSRLRYVKTLMERLNGDFCQTRYRASTSTSRFKDMRLNRKIRIILTGNRNDCDGNCQGFDEMSPT